jgi:hypothetical protein
MPDSRTGPLHRLSETTPSCCRSGPGGVIDIVMGLQHPLALTGHVTKDVQVAVGHELWPPWRRGARVRHWNLALVASPSSQPRIAVNSTNHTSATCEAPKTQLTLTCAVFETASAIRYATRATAAIA